MADSPRSNLSRNYGRHVRRFGAERGDIGARQLRLNWARIWQELREPSGHIYVQEIDHAYDSHSCRFA